MSDVIRERYSPVMDSSYGRLVKNIRKYFVSRFQYRGIAVVEHSDWSPLPPISEHGTYKTVTPYKSRNRESRIEIFNNLNKPLWLWAMGGTRRMNNRYDILTNFRLNMANKNDMIFLLHHSPPPHNLNE